MTRVATVVAVGVIRAGHLEFAACLGDLVDRCPCQHPDSDHFDGRCLGHSHTNTCTARLCSADGDCGCGWRSR